METSEEKIKSDLYQAMRNYRGAVRWFKETITYRAAVAGNEWTDQGKWLIADAADSYREVIVDIKKFRRQIDTLKRKLQLMQRSKV